MSQTCLVSDMDTTLQIKCSFFLEESFLLEGSLTIGVICGASNLDKVVFLLSKNFFFTMEILCHKLGYFTIIICHTEFLLILAIEVI